MVMPAGTMCAVPLADMLFFAMLYCISVLDYEHLIAINGKIEAKIAFKMNSLRTYALRTQ